MTTIEQHNWVDLDLYDSEGDRIGKVTDVISDPHTMERMLLVVKPGLLRGEHVIPIDAVRPRGEHLVTDVTKTVVTSAPKAPDHVAPEGEALREIFDHYGMRMPSRS